MENQNYSKKYIIVLTVVLFLFAGLVKADLPFDPNNYNFLIYDPGNGSRIIPAMEKILGRYVDDVNELRDKNHPVTPNDLATHDILIAGENYNGDVTGLHADDLLAGITGRVVLSGHDADQHAFPFSGDPVEAAEKMLIQSIDYILQGDGTGMLTLGCSDAFSYLPEDWDVTATYLGNTTGRDDVNEFTAHGLHSEIFDGLDPCDLSDWNKSYHNLFTIAQNSNFVPFELSDDANFITIARTNYGPLFLSKTDDKNGACVEPLDTIVYNICFDPCGHSDTNIVILDTLPDGVDFWSSSDPCYYDPCTHTVTWLIGDLSGDDSNCITLTVTVNPFAIPGVPLKNVVEMYGDSYYTSMSVKTCVNCWTDRIIYVDDDASDGGNGSSWQTAFNNIQDALAAAENADCDKVMWIAGGTYQPVNDIGVQYWDDYSFELFDGIGIIGHFEGNETSPYERNLADANNDTILTGQIGQESYQRIDNVITGDAVTDVLLDGLTVTAGSTDNIHLDNDSNVAMVNCMVNCKVADSMSVGVRLTGDSVLSAHNCIFKASSSAASIVLTGAKVYATECAFDGDGTGVQGIYTYSGSEVSLDGCLFTGHTGTSLTMYGSDITIADSSFSETNSQAIDIEYSSVKSVANITHSNITNGNGSTGGYGIRIGSSDITIEDCNIENCYNYGILFQGKGAVSIKDSVIRNNQNDGIYYYADQSPDSLTIDRCFIYGNGDGSGESGIYISDTDNASVTNCWIYDNYHSGIYLSANQTVNLRNNTIYGNNRRPNNNYGIYLSYGTAPSITNCIVWDHYDDLYQCTATYSCIEDAFDANDPNFAGSINSDPCFYNSSNDDYHLTDDSPCIDKGTGTYPNEIDFDGEDRVIDGDDNGTEVVDMGADEYFWPKADYNKDEIVNFVDYRILANEWLDVNQYISLDIPRGIDINDLALFCEDWLWYAPWGDNFSFFRTSGGFGADMLMSEPISPRTCAGGLMLTDVSESIKAMPDSLYAKVEKFYAVNAYNNVNAIREAQKQLEQIDVEEILDWLDELWESGDIQESMTYQDYIDFREAIKLSADYDY